MNDRPWIAHDHRQTPKGYLDIYAAVSMPRPSLMDLGQSFVQRTVATTNPSLAIVALRALGTRSRSR